MSWAGGQNYPIYLNFYLQKSLRIFEKNSAGKNWSYKDKGIKMLCPVQTGLSQYYNPLTEIPNFSDYKWSLLNEPSCSYYFCENGGVCLPQSSGGAKCLCQLGFIGNNCDTKMSLLFPVKPSWQRHYAAPEDYCRQNPPFPPII